MHRQEAQSPPTLAPPTARDRIGIAIADPNAASLIAIIEAAEAGGVRQLWMTQGPTSVDTLTVYAAALGRTTTVRLGTSIIPTYPRHPLALAQQAASVAALGPGRLRLGVGPSHRPSIEGVYGLPMNAPLAHLRDYVAVLRAALWEGTVAHEGRFYTARATLPTPPQVPILVSALSAGAFHLAGEIADGAISWNCPVPYLRDVALPALREGAKVAGRDTPPLVAHVWVGLSTDVAAVRSAARQRLRSYARLPFYANMFRAAGFPVEADGRVSDDLVDSLVVTGTDAAVTRRLQELLDNDLDEVLLTLVPLENEAAERTRLFRLIGQMDGKGS